MMFWPWNHTWQQLSSCGVCVGSPFVEFVWNRYYIFYITSINFFFFFFFLKKFCFINVDHEDLTCFNLNFLFFLIYFYLFIYLFFFFRMLQPKRLREGDLVKISRNLDVIRKRRVLKISKRKSRSRKRRIEKQGSVLRMKLNGTSE